MNIYATIGLMNGLAAILIGLYVFFKGRSNAVYLRFGIFCLTVSGWSILYSVWQQQETPEKALYFMRLTMIPCYFIPFAFLWFVQSLVDEDSNKKSRFPFYFVIPLIFCLFNFSPLMVASVTSRLIFPFWPVPGKLMHICVIVFNGSLILSFFYLFRAWFQSKGMRRWQLKWITLTTFVMWAGGSTNWFLWYNIPILPIPNIFVAIFLFILAYAIIRRRLFDVSTLADIVREARLVAMGMMAASLNHELRNPLYIAKGKIETQLDAIHRHTFSNSGEEASQSRTVLETSLDQISRAMDIVRRFSEFMKEKPPTIGEETTALSDVVASVNSLASAELRAGNVFFRADNLESIFLRVRKRDLEEIIFNLIVNACHAVKGLAGGEIRIMARREGDRGIIEVQDTGPGIARDLQRRIFEPFVTTNTQTGHGLGLYITKHLVEQNSGKINVKSAPGSGTAFVLEFNLAGKDAGGPYPGS